MKQVVTFRSAGVPVPGLTPTWVYLKRIRGRRLDGDVIPLPTITEIGSGLYTYDAPPVEDAGPTTGVIDGGDAIIDPRERYLDVRHYIPDSAGSARSGRGTIHDPLQHGTEQP